MTLFKFLSFLMAVAFYTSPVCAQESFQADSFFSLSDCSARDCSEAFESDLNFDTSFDDAVFFTDQEVDNLLCMMLFLQLLLFLQPGL